MNIDGLCNHPPTHPQSAVSAGNSFSFREIHILTRSSLSHNKQRAPIPMACPSSFLISVYLLSFYSVKFLSAV